MTADGNRTVLISGGSRGLGQALVADFLQLGHRVATFSRSKTPFIEECLGRPGGNFLWSGLDISDPDAVHEFVDRTYRSFGSIDVLVNNAAIAVGGLMPLTMVGDIQKQVRTNIEGPLVLIRACARIMLAQRRGSIINIGSITGIRGFTGLSVYSATKAALEGCIRSLARELGSRGIRVNSVAPGYIATEMSSALTEGDLAQITRRTPLGRLCEFEDVSAMVQFLASDRAAFVTGQTIVIDGGLTC